MRVRGDLAEGALFSPNENPVNAWEEALVFPTSSRWRNAHTRSRGNSSSPVSTSVEYDYFPTKSLPALMCKHKLCHCLHMRNENKQVLLLLLPVRLSLPKHPVAAKDRKLSGNARHTCCLPQLLIRKYGR